MARTVVIVGALDTKGGEFAYLKERIEACDVETLVVDFGTMGPPAFQPDVDRAEVAAAGGGDLVRLASGEHKDEAMLAMARGLAVVVRRLYDEGQLDAIVGMGGSGGTSIATAAMRELPVGLPKLMVSTFGGGDVTAFAGAKDITFMPSIVDVSGFNRISRRIYANAAAAIAGMAKAEVPSSGSDRPMVAASMFGNTTKAVDRAREMLDAKGYEVLVFHAMGTGGRTMESLVADGLFAAVLDMTTTEIADEVCGGILSAGPERCLAASRAGVPAVIVPGCVDMANFGAVETVPEKYRGRNLYRWNLNTTLLRTDSEENRRIGETLAAAANASSAPVAILFPHRGLSMLDSEGNEFWDPIADQACCDGIKATLKRSIPLIEMDNNINDPEFAERTVEVLLDLIDQTRP